MAAPPAAKLSLDFDGAGAARLAQTDSLKVCLSQTADWEVCISSDASQGTSPGGTHQSESRCNPDAHAAPAAAPATPVDLEMVEVSCSTAPTVVCAAAALTTWRFSGEDCISLNLDGRCVLFNLTTDTSVSRLIEMSKSVSGARDADATASVSLVAPGAKAPRCGTGNEDPIGFCCRLEVGSQDSWELWVQYDAEKVAPGTALSLLRTWRTSLESILSAQAGAAIKSIEFVDTEDRRQVLDELNSPVDPQHHGDLAQVASAAYFCPTGCGRFCCNNLPAALRLPVAIHCVLFHSTLYFGAS